MRHDIDRKMKLPQFRRSLLHSINGDIFFPLSCWPEEYKALFWQKPISDRGAFQLMLFFVGNGCPITTTCTWILSSLKWSNDPLVYNKRCIQLSTIAQSLQSKQDVWFYHDIIHQRLVFFNGNFKLF